MFHVELHDSFFFMLTLEFLWVAVAEERALVSVLCSGIWTKFYSSLPALRFLIVVTCAVVFHFSIFNHRMWNLAFWSGAQCHSIKVTTCVCHVSPFLATLVLNQRVKFHFCHCVSTFSLLFIFFTHHPACIWNVMIVSWHEPESFFILRCRRSFVDFLKCLNHFKNAPELSYQHCFPVK